MKKFQERIDKFVNSKPSKAETVISYSLLGLSMSGLLTVMVLVIIHFVH